MNKYQSYLQLQDNEWCKEGSIWDIIGMGEYAQIRGYIKGVVSTPIICVSELRANKTLYRLIEEKENKHAASRPRRK